MKNLFTDHPHSLNESYFEHLYFASCFGFSMLMGGMACLIHGIFPFWFKNTGSDFLLKLVTNYIKRVPKPDERILAIHQCIEQKKCHGRND